MSDEFPNLRIILTYIDYISNHRTPENFPTHLTTVQIVKGSFPEVIALITDQPQAWMAVQPGSQTGGATSAKTYDGPVHLHQVVVSVGVDGVEHV